MTSYRNWTIGCVLTASYASACSGSDEQTLNPETSSSTNQSSPSSSNGSTAGGSASTSSGGTSSNSSGSNGSGSSTRPGGQSPNTGVAPVGSDSGDEAFDSCKDYDFAIGLPKEMQPTGTARVTLPAADGSMAHEADLSEATCEVYHRVDGKVLGYGASFFKTWESPSFTPEYAAVRWIGDYEGDGDYEDAAFEQSAGDGPFGRDETSRNGTLSISQGGKAGTFKDEDGNTLITFSCQDSEKLAAAPKAPAADTPPGTLRFVGSYGVVYEIHNITCGTEASGDFEITNGVATESPYAVHVLLDGSGNGAHRVSDGSVDYAGLAEESEFARVTLTCGSPAQGTIDLGVPNNGVYPLQGSFTCRK